MQSLLGQFYHKIKISQEDLASESLVYILNKSARARQTINKIIKLNTDLEFSDLIYQTQNVGKNLERPDISGIDNQGNEVLLIEAKFWASLTSNQPNEYLKRLNENSVLMFLVPTLRERTIFEEIKIRVESEFNDFILKEDKRIIKLQKTNKYILIKSWNKILNAIKEEVAQEENQILLSDINQLIGFCETVDNNSFQPITDEDLSPKIPRNIISYIDIIDKVVAELKNKRNDVKTKGLLKARKRYSFRRYFAINNYGYAIAFELDLWAKEADTPFWLSLAKVKDTKTWVIDNKFALKCKSIADKLKLHFVQKVDEVLISLPPKLNVTEDELIKDLAIKCEKIFKELDKNG